MATGDIPIKLMTCWLTILTAALCYILSSRCVGLWSAAGLVARLMCILSCSVHKCCCRECALAIKQLQNPLCPICRQSIQAFILNFY